MAASQKEITQRAASRRGIDEHEIIRLAARDREVFVDALLQPPALSPKLRAVAKRYKDIVRLQRTR